MSELVEASPGRDPHPLYSRLRADHPVHWSELLGSWVLTRHEDCTSVLRDSRSFASDWRRIGEDVPEPMLSIQTVDPPEHTGIRHFLVDAVRAIDHRALEETIARQVDARLKDLGARDGFDFVADFAEPVALHTVTAFLGVPPIDLDWFRPVSQAIVDGMDAGIWPEKAGPAVRARALLAEMSADWLADPPGGGLVGYVAAHEAGSGISRPVLLNTLRAVLHAGYESAGRLLTGGMAALLAEPDALPLLARGDLARAVEEIVRFVSPVQADGRACVIETTIGGHTIKAGDPVTMLLGAANRDPSRFAEPDALDFSRHPNPHLGFGRGAHSCLGQSLATLQARIVFGTIAAEHPGIHATGRAVWRGNLTLRGVARLPVSLS
ncbi:cytochrome P450 [Thermomonospora cellulosilytica]|uniref:Cytochrome P450 n=1 Tax=Thermomonospora cellulosilytica TaxID=1411118 RepID=A0A7W3RD46_9ACTN|nr:cytochrome P450 [Thermomonospora cellulosilytica]MBA9007935.1 cytochrome P450 [Thermomonospora cellulosilytica]